MDNFSREQMNMSLLESSRRLFFDEPLYVHYQQISEHIPLDESVRYTMRARLINYFKADDELWYGEFENMAEVLSLRESMSKAPENPYELPEHIDEIANSRYLESMVVLPTEQEIVRRQLGKIVISTVSPYYA